MRIEIGRAKSKFELRDASVGLSFEATDLADPRLDPANSNLDDLVKKLDHPALRFGGNSLDRRFFWTSSGEKKPKWATVSVGPNDLRRLKRLLDATGSKVTLGVNLGHFDPKRAGDMAKYAHRILGGRLIGVAIGNEPNGYATGDKKLDVRPQGWTTAKYIKQVQAYSAAIHALSPTVPIIGPDAYDAQWWRAFTGAKIPRSAAMTQHWYPLYACGKNGKEKYSPKATNLVAPGIHDKTSKMLSWAHRAAGRAGLPLWLDETGPTSCPGSNGAASSHAEALWAVDYTLNAASHGVRRLAMHSSLAACNGGPPISMVCAGGSYDDPSGQFRGRSGYAALAAVASIPNGRFMSARVHGSKHVFAYAISAGNTIAVVVINELDPVKYKRARTTVTLPVAGKRVRAYQLAGPSLQADDASVINGRRALAGPIEPKPLRGDRRGKKLRLTLNAGTATVLEIAK
ncbi:hypothetical protein [Spelaeicoccus albus]|uniref:Glycosyl hydrolase family 79 n=1 Tax=Spelaeicoccus albus TaxID=1280376 RepID=A0A7Z0AAS9_9MICO|nr:hypothetical protein [Spelaeicoccus albus]NYI66470.1 hypothetical protein [Spelaeicoccus albus]